MRVKRLAENGRRSFAVVLEPGDEAVGCLLDFAREHEVHAGHFTGLGAFSDVTLGFFDPERRDYERIVLDEQVEIVSLVGNFAMKDGETKLHPHIVVGRRDGRAFGGHLMEGHVRPILEVIVEDEPAHLQRETDEATGLPLLKP